MERLDAHVASAQATLQKAPEILDAVGVDVAIHVRFHVVDYIVGIVGLKPKICVQFISENVGAIFDVLLDVGDQGPAFRIADDGGSDGTAALKNTLYSN